MFGGYRSEREEFEHWYLRDIQMLLLFVQVGFDLKTPNTYIPAVNGLTDLMMTNLAVRS